MDGPQSSSVNSIVDGVVASHTDAIIRLENPKRAGFVAAVNVGMRISERDVVLLNSDTVVTADWLERLMDAAYSSGDIGTVTPFSNHATLCSIPRPHEENLLPTGFDAATFDRLVEGVSQRVYPRVPTGVGMCLYIRRALIDEIGVFDEVTFGLGYGEENDFCFRALKRGWLNVIDDATFVYHAGEGSFGSSAIQAQRRGSAALARLHPEYDDTIGEFMSNDSTAPARQRVMAKLRPVRNVLRTREPARVVHLVHGWPPFNHAGSELYAKWLVDRQLRWRDVAVYARIEARSRVKGQAIELLDQGARVRLVVNNFVQRNPRSRNSIADSFFDADFARFLAIEKPDLVHIHHLIGHAFSLAAVARKFNVPIIYQIQDWWSLCARINLFDWQWQRCSGPGFFKCSVCAPLTTIRPARVWNKALHLDRRRQARRAFTAADAYIMGSEFIRKDYAAAGLLEPSKPAFVIPYGIDLPPSRTVRGPVRKPIRFGYIGSVLPHKGVHIAVEAFRDVPATDASFRIWGDLRIAPEYVDSLRAKAGSAAISFAGTFNEEEKAQVFEAIDVLIVPSVGLESFGLVAREAMARRVPVIASRDGALTELLPPGSGGAFFTTNDPDGLRALIEEIVRSPAVIDAWSEALPEPKTVDRHAEEIEEVYAAVLAERR